MVERVRHETFTRITVRSATWRVGGVILAAALTWALTGSWVLGIELGILYNSIRFVTHIIHDYAWSFISWGYRLNDAGHGGNRSELEDGK